MEEHYLESAEFYNRRYSSFSVRVILPTFFLLIFVVLFSLFAKKEITITSGASIEPSKILANIQSTSNNAIVTNNLKENKVVKKGDLLVQYKSDSENTQKETFSSQVESLKEQKRQLELLQERIASAMSKHLMITRIKLRVSVVIPSSKIRPLLLKIQQLVIHRQSWGI